MCLMVKGKTMPVQSVSLNNVAFRGETPKTEAVPKTEAKTAEKQNADGKKIAIALGGLAAAGIAAVLIGKSRKVPSELSLEEFKKIGSFDKGFATAKKKPFSGIINTANKNGNYKLEYDKGVLKQSTLFKEIAFPEFRQPEPKMMPVSKKVYSNGDEGKKVECFMKNHHQAIYGGEEWGKIGGLTVSADKSSVIKEYTTPTGEKLQDAIIKQKDGSWARA